jgi:hypothetical protein
MIARIAELLFALSASGAEAHDYWSDGKRIPDWVKASCCGPADAHHLRPEQVHRASDNYYTVDGYVVASPSVRRCRARVETTGSSTGTMAAEASPGSTASLCRWTSDARSFRDRWDAPHGYRGGRPRQLRSPLRASDKLCWRWPHLIAPRSPLPTCSMSRAPVSASVWDWLLSPVWRGICAAAANWPKPGRTAVRSLRSRTRMVSGLSADSPPTTKPSSTSPLPKRSAAAPSDVEGLGNREVHRRDLQRPLGVCAVTRRRFPVGASPTRQPLQPEATGAVMGVTKWLKPSVSQVTYR